MKNYIQFTKRRIKPIKKWMRQHNCDILRVVTDENHENTGKYVVVIYYLDWTTEPKYVTLTDNWYVWINKDEDICFGSELPKELKAE